MLEYQFTNEDKALLVNKLEALQGLGVTGLMIASSSPIQIALKHIIPQWGLGHIPTEAILQYLRDELHTPMKQRLFRFVIRSKINALADIEAWESEDLFELLCLAARYEKTGYYTIEIQEVK